MYIQLVKEGAEVLLVPSAFTVPTGTAHWHTLLRGTMFRLSWAGKVKTYRSRSAYVVPPSPLCSYHRSHERIGITLNSIHLDLTARAIESQCFVVAAAQFGEHNAKRKSYGHSLVVDPWGKILVDAGGYGDSDTENTTAATTNTTGTGSSVTKTTLDSFFQPLPSIVTCEIDRELITAVRERIPVQLHRTECSVNLGNTR